MKRLTVFLVLVVFIVLGSGFLVLIWMDMRGSIRSRTAQPHGSSRTRQRNEGGRDKEGKRRPRELPHTPDDQAGNGEACSSLGISCASQYFATWTWPADGSCQAILHAGYPEPDRRCTPGGVVPGVTADTLRSPDWRTKCIRNCQSSEKQKHATYAWYGLDAPEGNSGENQTCELDHLVPLELGGADGMGNIWPECGPADVTLRKRYFKQKDQVENYLAAQVRAGEMPLAEAQRGIASDWVRYLPLAVARCRGARCQEVD